jgi:hypothetical protein
VLGALIGNRVPAAVELAGLDIAEVGLLAYPADYEGSDLPVGKTAPAAAPLGALSATEAV